MEELRAWCLHNLHRHRSHSSIARVCWQGEQRGSRALRIGVYRGGIAGVSGIKPKEAKPDI